MVGYGSGDSPHPAHRSASFKLAVEDCLDASFRVFLEDLYSALYAAAAAMPMPLAGPGAAAAGGKQQQEEEEGAEGEGVAAAAQESGQDSRPEVRRVASCRESW